MLINFGIILTTQINKKKRYALGFKIFKQTETKKVQPPKIMLFSETIIQYLLSYIHLPNK